MTFRYSRKVEIIWKQLGYNRGYSIRLIPSRRNKSLLDKLELQDTILYSQPYINFFDPKKKLIYTPFLTPETLDITISPPASPIVLPRRDKPPSVTYLIRRRRHTRLRLLHPTLPQLHKPGPLRIRGYRLHRPFTLVPRRRRAGKRHVVMQRRVSAGRRAEQQPAPQGRKVGGPLRVAGRVAHERTQVGQDGADHVGGGLDDGPGHGRDAEVGGVSHEVVGEEVDETDEGGDDAAGL